MLKLKICSTIFILYEIVAIILLHCPQTCDAMFSGAFCDDHVFKYFIMCFAVPAIVMLAIMWISEIVHGARRRHSLTYRAKSAVMGVVDNVREKVSEHVSTQDLEKLITAALVLGLKKYANRHPKLRRNIKEMMNTDLSEYEFDEDDYDETYDNKSDKRSERKSSKKQPRKK